MCWTTKVFLIGIDFFTVSLVFVGFILEMENSIIELRYYVVCECVSFAMSPCMYFWIRQVCVELEANSK